MQTILIIDDESAIRKYLQQLFEKNGYRTVSAENGKKGMTLLHEHQPDLVITDLIMPDKEGLETIREIKKMDHDIKIIAISGGGAGDPRLYLKFARNLGAHMTFTKPVESDVLLDSVKQLLT